MPARRRPPAAQVAAAVGAEPVRWLDAEEMSAWLALLRVLQLLPQQLDRQLREQAGVNHTYYMLMALLSSRPGREMTLSSLAAAAAMIPSRLTHALGSLEQRGWVQRRPCPGDRRVQYARLTDDGLRLLEQVAPGHVAEVRRRVVDALDREDLEHLQRIAGKIVATLEEGGLSKMLEV